LNLNKLNDDDDKIQKSKQLFKQNNVNVLQFIFCCQWSAVDWNLDYSKVCELAWYCSGEDIRSV